MRIFQSMFPRPRYLRENGFWIMHSEQQSRDIMGNERRKTVQGGNECMRKGWEEMKHAWGGWVGKWWGGCKDGVGVRNPTSVSHPPWETPWSLKRHTNRTSHYELLHNIQIYWFPWLFLYNTAITHTYNTYIYILRNKSENYKKTYYF